MDTRYCQRLGVTHSTLPACCVRIHPIHTSIIAIGTYKLEENGLKHGSIEIFKYEKSSANLLLISQKRLPSAVLDLKLHDHDSSILISAQHTGEVIVWKFETDWYLARLHTVQVFDLSVVTTSVFCHPTDRSKLLATGTNGQAAIADLDSGSISKFFTSHELECWTGAFGELGQLTNVVFTGGDDSQLIAHDTRTNEKIWATSYRHHEAGVVSILAPSERWNTENSNHLWTGSYDDNLRIFDLRVMDKKNPLLIAGLVPRTLRQENLGGGVWRLVPSPLDNDNRVLACCMYDGARVIDTTLTGFEVAGYFKKDHESICYGGDWSNEGDFVATASFYDQVIQVWSPDEIE